MYPNATSYSKYYRNNVCKCGGLPNGEPIYDTKTKTYPGACLYNIFSDPTEHNDISATYPNIVRDLSIRIKQLSLSVNSPLLGNVTSLSCDTAYASWGGFCGPFLFNSITDVKYVSYNITKKTVVSKFSDKKLVFADKAKLKWDKKNDKIEKKEKKS